MNSLFSVFLSYLLAVVLMAAYGLFLHFLISSALPEKAKFRFFDYVPFAPRLRYAVILYPLAAFIYLQISSELLGAASSSVLHFLVGTVALVAASLAVRLIANLFHQDLEESQEDEIRRKRENRFNF